MNPNILLIVADDLGYGDIDRFNGGRSRTPAISDLFRGGVELSQHYAGSCVCAPSRAALLTGKYAHRTGAIDTIYGRGLDRISLRERTMADELFSLGYRTGLFGKWHNGAIDVRYHPLRRGFEEFVGFIGGQQDYYSWVIEEGKHYRRADGRYLTDVIGEGAVEFIRRHARERWFCLVAFNAPHVPLQAPGLLVSKYREAGESEGVARIYGMVEALDRSISRILDTLCGLGLEENTLVMFVSDNGPQLGCFEGLDITRPNCGYRGSKGNVYEGGIRVPCVVRWPSGGAVGGREVRSMVHFTDWLPTLVGVAGGSGGRVPCLDGVDQRGVFSEVGGYDGGLVRFWQWNRYDPVPHCNIAMRDGRWKLVYPQLEWAMRTGPGDTPAADEEVQAKMLRGELQDVIRVEPGIERVAPTDREEWGRPQLFDVETDPAEQEDLAQREEGRCAVMRLRLETWFEDMVAQCKEAQSEWRGGSG